MNIALKIKNLYIVWNLPEVNVADIGWPRGSSMDVWDNSTSILHFLKRAAHHHVDRRMRHISFPPSSSTITNLSLPYLHAHTN